MNNRLHLLRSKKIGLALSGGGVRGLAHIGVIKALAEVGIRPAFIAGTSAGSIIGAGMAAGMDWRDLATMARSVFWPGLLHGGRLERFCAGHLPERFSQLTHSFVAVATSVPDRRVVALKEGPLASAISASCAIPFLRRPVEREGERLVDGGVACVMPSAICSEQGAEFVIASDVWEYSSLMSALGCHPASVSHSRFFPRHYRLAVSRTDLHIRPSIPLSGYVPGAAAIERMIATGEDAARRAIALLPDRLQFRPLPPDEPGDVHRSP
jgi:NTE family protein